MLTRKKISPATIEAVAGELAGLPLGRGRAKLHAEALQGLMNEIARLRELPLKEVEPAFIYRPIEAPARRRK
jgi:hypothetical protein